MILIKSNGDDYSTTQVVKWLKHSNADFLRLNDTTFLKDLKVIGNAIEFAHDGNTISLGNVSKYWYRRGRWDTFSRRKLRNVNDKTFHGYLNYFSKEAERDITNTIENSLADRSLNQYQTSSNINKLAVLEACKTLNITTPKTLITNSKAVLKEFIITHTEIITKAVNNLDPNIKGDVFADLMTKKITLENIDILPDSFNVSLFQNLVAKEFEIRTFFLVDTFYSMAIFSQNDDKTKVDFRNYNMKSPNRCVPYQLPTSLETKLRALLEKFKLNSASLDIIYTTENEYSFLEINPIGQYDMVSKPCNYFLDEKIANYLTS
ncbi:grasp-with-spasm system ATP-grasp peptide maturase [Kordia sp. YSTF-M3]|uniref:Grasp-with-spasm system ATP-grasp peptide maturase n=1 Tax=Kordia aestuariivivens TaxID=2759037 RepID=A0ABR7Q5D1_9FLAO|nr:grasp-with-spasm system ATP-grasp peptide maturase [Kordia aestuariivivens]MBC8753775.1 grasp-with-spasm system ATP-grasp peptide maturase [Kordia aestuariivivens]